MEELQNYLNTLTTHTTTHSNMIAGAFSQNTAVDVLLQYYYFCAKEHDIRMDIRFCMPQQEVLSDIELCTVSKRFGIGLESVKDIVEKHNGNLDIYPKANIFRVGITLPMN